MVIHLNQNHEGEGEAASREQAIERWKGEVSSPSWLTGSPLMSVKAPFPFHPRQDPPTRHHGLRMEWKPSLYILTIG
jgi:hypothetical protein